MKLVVAGQGIKNDATSWISSSCSHPSMVPCCLHSSVLKVSGLLMTL